MNSSNFLQIFLIINVFIMGVLAAIAFRHARAHFSNKKNGTDKTRPQPQTVQLPHDVREKLLESSRVRFQTVLNHSANELQQSLGETVSQLNKKLEKVGNEIIDTETKRYQLGLEELRKKSESMVVEAQSEIVNHQADLKTKLSDKQAELEANMIEKVNAEKQLLVAAIETKLSDAVASFLVETLQHNVDLGAQSAYLTSMLEEHKSELTKGMSDET